MRNPFFLSVLAFAACYADRGGAPPVTTEFNFPTGIVGSTLTDSSGNTIMQGHYLFVLNSDFDLRYNAGSVLALDWDASSTVSSPKTPTAPASIAATVLSCKKLQIGLLDGNGNSLCFPPVGTQLQTAIDDSIACQQQLYNAGCIQPESPIPGVASDSGLNEPTQASLDTANFVRASVTIGAFGAGLAVVPRRNSQKNGEFSHVDPTSNNPIVDPATGIMAPGGRILVPVRGDATLTVIDYDEQWNTATSNYDIRLICSANADWNQTDVACDSKWKFGQDQSANTREITLEGYPIAIATPSYLRTTTCPALAAGQVLGLGCWDTSTEPAYSGGIAALVHEVTGDVSVFEGTEVDSMSPPNGPFLPPTSVKLVHTLTGLLPQATSIRSLDFVPPPPTTSNPNPPPFIPRFVIANELQDYMPIVQYNSDSYTNLTTSPDGGCDTCDRSFMSFEQNLPIDAESLGTTSDNADIAIIPPTDSSSTIYGMYVVARHPASLVVGRFDSSTMTASFSEILPLPVGPSRVGIATIQKGGVSQPLVVVSSFDGRYVTTYDPLTDLIGDFIPTQKGPYALAFATITDSTNNTSFPVVVVTNFTDSTIQVIDLDSSAPTYQTVLLTIGTPNAPPQ